MLALKTGHDWNGDILDRVIDLETSFTGWQPLIPLLMAVDTIPDTCAIECLCGNVYPHVRQWYIDHAHNDDRDLFLLVDSKQRHAVINVIWPIVCSHADLHDHDAPYWPIWSTIHDILLYGVKSEIIGADLSVALLSLFARHITFGLHHALLVLSDFLHILLAVNPGVSYDDAMRYAVDAMSRDGARTLVDRCVTCGVPVIGDRDHPMLPGVLQYHAINDLMHPTNHAPIYQSPFLSRADLRRAELATID